MILRISEEFRTGPAFTERTKGDIFNGRLFKGKCSSEVA